MDYIKGSMDYGTCFNHLTREEVANYLDTLTLIGVGTKMIGNQHKGTSFYI